MTNRRGQVTIFIIVALVLVVGIALFLYLRGAIRPTMSDIAEENPEAFMQLCVFNHTSRSICKSC